MGRPLAGWIQTGRSYSAIISYNGKNSGESRGLPLEGVYNWTPLKFRSSIALSASFRAASISLKGRQATAAVNLSGYLICSPASSLLPSSAMYTASSWLTASRSEEHTSELQSRLHLV